jgi:hypothetical protein
MTPSGDKLEVLFAGELRVSDDNIEYNLRSGTYMSRVLEVQYPKANPSAVGHSKKVIIQMALADKPYMAWLIRKSRRAISAVLGVEEGYLAFQPHKFITTSMPVSFQYLRDLAAKNVSVQLFKTVEECSHFVTSSAIQRQAYVVELRKQQLAALAGRKFPDMQQRAEQELATATATLEDFERRHATGMSLQDVLSV